MNFLTIFAWIILIFNGVMGAYGLSIGEDEAWINIGIFVIWALAIRFMLPKRPKR